MNTASKYTWRLVEKKNETPQIESLYLEAITEKPQFIAGQYLTIQLPNQNPTEGKAYSISSEPQEKLLRISIKKMGTFSSALLSLPIGSTITTSAPYGFFYPEPDDTTPLVFLAGSIGIAPILSIINDLNCRDDERRVSLFYSNKTIANIAFFSELASLEKANPSLTIQHCITREVIESDTYHTGRITPELIAATIPDYKNVDFFLCGSMDFTKSLWKSLREYGIPAHHLYTEGFF
jgi:ferredoxin-NADP reductase